MSDFGLGTWIRRRQEKSPDRIAIRFGRNELSYTELADQVERLSRVLVELGIRRGDRVAFLGGNHPLFVEAMFATVAVGAIFVPLNVRLARDELRFMLNDSRATVLVHTAEQTDPAGAAAEGSPLRYRITTHTSTMGIEESPAELKIADLLRGDLLETGRQGGKDVHESDIRVSLGDPAIIMYTSGTTGRPKGAVLTHENLTWHAMNVLVDYDILVTDIGFPIAPIFHVNALGMCVLPILIKGGTLVLQEKFDAGDALRLIEQHGVTVLSAVPTTLQLLTEHPDWQTTRLETVSTLMCGGSAIPARVLRAVEEKNIVYTGGYGLTEATAGVTAIPRGVTHKDGSSGLPHMFTGVRIRDSEGTEMPSGEVGEIQVAGPNVFSGYWGLPDASVEARTEDGWLRTGDLGFLDVDGFLYVKGRAKDMILSGGENVYPAEIEELIMEMPQIRSVAVIGVLDEKWGEVAKVVVTLHDGTSCSLEKIREHLDGRIARFKLPKHYAEVVDLPRTSSGKVRKDLL